MLKDLRLLAMSTSAPAFLVALLAALLAASAASLDAGADKQGVHDTAAAAGDDADDAAAASVPTAASCCTSGVVHADCFGFQPGKATASIQAALNCTTAHTVIVKNMGSPWIVAPQGKYADKGPNGCEFGSCRRAALNFTSNQLVVFQDGVVVEALRWDFHGAGDVFAYVGNDITPVVNLTIRGEGNVTWQMWKQDYQQACPKGVTNNATCYQFSAQRHGLNLWHGINVTVSGITINNTGGDGIETGGLERGNATGMRTKNVVLRNMTLSNNLRQGMSVISAEGLLVEDCVFSGTFGADPMAGVDIEPDNYRSTEREIVFRRCVAHNNEGAGFMLAGGALTPAENDAPITILFEDCHVSWDADFKPQWKYNGVGRGGYYIGTTHVGGSISIIGGSVQGSPGPGIKSVNKQLTGPALTISNVSLKNTAWAWQGNGCNGQPAPIVLYDEVGGIGGITFENVTVDDGGKARPFLLYNSEPCGFAKRPVSPCPNVSADIRGSFIVVGATGVGCETAIGLKNCSSKAQPLHPTPTQHMQLGCWNMVANRTLFGAHALENLTVDCAHKSDDENRETKRHFNRAWHSPVKSTPNMRRGKHASTSASFFFGSSQLSFEIDATTLGLINVTSCPNANPEAVTLSTDHMGSGHCQTASGVGFVWAVPSVLGNASSALRSQFPLWKLNTSDCTQAPPDGQQVDALGTGSGVSTSRSHRVIFDESSTTLLLRWGFVTLGTLPAETVAVSVNLTIPTARPSRAELTARVDKQGSSKVCILALSLPDLASLRFHSPETDSIFLPEFFGHVGATSDSGSDTGRVGHHYPNLPTAFPEYQKTFNNGELNYAPNGNMLAMQWFALWSNATGRSIGLYISTHDRVGRVKLTLAEAAHPKFTPGCPGCKRYSGGAALAFYHLPDDLLSKGSFVTQYPTVIEAFEGNWWDASQIYRDFVIPQPGGTGAVWTRKGDLESRHSAGDILSWLLRTPIWSQGGGPFRPACTLSTSNNEAIADRIIRFKELTGTRRRRIIGISGRSSYSIQGIQITPHVLAFITQWKRWSRITSTLCLTLTSD